MELLGIKDFPGKFESFKNHTLEGYCEDSTLVSYKGTYTEVIKFLKQRPRAIHGLNGNISDFNEYLYRPDEPFISGTFEQLISDDVCLKDYKAERERLKTTKIWKKMRDRFIVAKSVGRQRDSYDGDYDHDKKWDIEPYIKRSNKDISKRVLNICVRTSFNANVSGAQINKFGIFIASIIGILEDYGILVSLENEKTNNAPGADINVLKMNLTIKRHDEYLPASNLVKIFSSNFYRRVWFVFIVSGCEFNKGTTSYGLGTPTNFQKPFEIIGNNLYLNSLPNESDQEKIMDQLTKFALGEE